MNEKKHDKKIWIVNKGLPIDNINIQLKKHIFLKTNLPLQFPLHIALQYVSKNKDVNICNNPQEYFKDRKLKRLILRDAGIGDLLMLEPILNKMAENKNQDVDIACMYPEVFENHPTINKVIKMEWKENLEKVNLKNYDCWEDLRNYSETSSLRDKRHRTDIYNEPFNLDLTNEEKEPKLYFKENEKSILQKNKGYIYTGIQCDASHKYRRYDRGKELIDYILKQNKKIIIVLLGSYEFVHNVNDKRVINLQGKTDRRQAICIVRDLDYLIAADSGLLHIALSMHIPSVAMFSIITPQFRLAYYTGEKRIIWKDLQCRGCGDWHMVKCKHVGKQDDIEFLAPCMNIEPSELYNQMMEMPINNNKRLFFNDKNIVKENIIEKKINIIPKYIGTKKLTMPIIVQDESHNLPRFIENVINHPSIGRVIAIDGGSKDNTIELLKKAGAEVYSHPYLKDYFNQQAIQREISFSYVKEGTPCIFFDIDECMNKELSDYLPELAENCPDYGLIARKTFNYYADINDDNKKIKDWPDLQPRIYRWKKNYKFSNGAHHITLNCPNPIIIDNDKYIIHFEKENGGRDKIEKQWATMMAGVKQYG